AGLRRRHRLPVGSQPHRPGHRRPAQPVRWRDRRVGPPGGGAGGAPGGGPTRRPPAPPGGGPGGRPPPPPRRRPPPPVAPPDPPPSPVAPPEAPPAEESDFTPANQVEEGLLDAVGEGSTDRFLSTLLLAKVLVPGPHDDAIANIDQWCTEQIDGHPYVVVFTSNEMLGRHLGEDVPATWIRFTQL